MKYEAIKSLYIHGKINADKVRSYAPRFITEAEAEEIIAMR